MEINRDVNGTHTLFGATKQGAESVAVGQQRDGKTTVDAPRLNGYRIDAPGAR